MIPANDITKWGVNHPWSTRDQIEQDLLLSQAICEIANNQFLNEELVIRGGTAFHKLFLPKPLRYSEDLDYVRTSAGGIGDILDQLVMLGKNLGYKVNTQIGQHPKVFWKGAADSGLGIKIKIEINTYERTPAKTLSVVRHSVDTEYYSSFADVRVFCVEELVATKIRALYQRSKGRDLFDLWLALEVLKLNPANIVEAFEPYRPESITSASAIKNMERKLSSKQFLEDLIGLVVSNEITYDPQVAGAVIIEKLLSRL